MSSKLTLLQIHLAQVDNSQGAKLIASNMRLNQHIVGAEPQGKARGFLNHRLLILLT